MQMKAHKDEKTGTWWFVRKIMQQVDNQTYIKNNHLKYAEFMEDEWLNSKEF
ncbi:hypothetical protein ABEW61_04205 [Paenibacillus amylolyticus]|uniref:hypothetical protein n=1 Tax=Paenibacillus amylolyticus TaxID=1451 RepID=UPI003D28E3AC